MNRAKILALCLCVVCVRADELLDTAPIAEPQAKDYKFFEWHNHIDPLDWAYVESLFSGAKLQEIKDAMLSGDLSKVWDAFDWSKLNYDYQKTSSFDERLGSYTIPFEARLYYFINHKWATYIGGVYHKGGLIDDARAFVGLNYKLFDIKLGYVAYVSEKFHGAKHTRIVRDGGVPLSLSIGAVF